MTTPATPPAAPASAGGSSEIDHLAPITNRTIAQSAVWRVVEAVGSETIALVVFVAMARLLVPEHFGIVALAGVFVAAGQVMLQQGLPDALIRSTEATAERSATAFWCNLAFGTALAALLGLLARPVAIAFAAPALEAVLMTLLLVLPLGGAAAVLQAKLVRRMAFKAVGVRTLVATTAGGIVGLGCAVAGAGAWSLVGLQLTSAVAGLLVLVIADPWRPRLCFDRRIAGELVRFALPVMGTHLAKFAGKKLDLAVLGLFVSATSIGHYFLATRLVFALGLATYYAIFTLALPVLARLTDAPDALHAAAGRTLWLTTAFCLPAGLGLALVADPLVPLLMGAVWQPSVPPLQILAGFSIAYALALVAGQIMVSAGSPGRFLRLTLANTSLFLVVVAIAAPWGLVAAALAGSLANVLMLPAYLVALERTVGLAPAVVLRDQLPVWLAAAVMALAVLGVHSGATDAFGPLPLLASAIATGAVTYALALWLFAGSTLRSLARTISADHGPGTHATTNTA